MKIDLHTHILPREWPDLDAKYGYGGFVRLDHYKPCCARMMIGDRVFREITDNVWDPKRRIEECDREKISMQVLSTVPVMFSYWAKPADALDLSRRLNDHIAEVVREHPTRFAGLATIPLQDPDLAAIELERCVRELGLRGAQIGTHVDANPHSGRIDTLNLDNASLQPVWNAAEQLDTAIFVHPWDMFGKERMPKYWLPWLVGMPAETSLAICSMIFGGVFDRFPKLRVRFCTRGRRIPIHDRPHRTCVPRPAGFGFDGEQNESAKISRSLRSSRNHSSAVLRGFACARCRRTENAHQPIRRSARRTRVGLSIPAGRNASRRSYPINEGTLCER